MEFYRPSYPPDFTPLPILISKIKNIEKNETRLSRRLINLI